MLDLIIESWVALMHSATGFAPGTQGFYVVCGVALFAAFVSARLMVGLFDSKRGIVATSSGMLLPLVAATVGYAIIEVQVLPHIEADWGASMPWVGFAVCLLGGLLLLTKRCFDLSFSISVFIFVLGSLAGAGGYVCSELVVDFMGSSEERLDHREQEINDGLKIAS